MRALPVVLVMTSRVATADSLTDGLHVEGWYGKAGVETGVVFGRDRGASPVAGGVATLVHINDDLEWIGLQGDALVDWNGDHDAGTRWSFGPEAGVSIFGADFSYFGERLDAVTRHGLQVRAKLTVGVAALYVRGAYVGDEKSVDFGLQLKAPVFVKRPKHRAYAVAAR